MLLYEDYNEDRPLALVVESRVPIPTVRRKVSFRDQRHHKRCQFNLALDEFDFSPLLLIEDPQIASDYMIDTLFDLYNLYCPLETVKLSNKDPPCMSTLVKLLLKKKQQLMRRHKHRDADLVSSQISALLVSNIASDKKAKGSAKWWKKSTPCLVGSRKKYYAFLSQQKK